MIARSTISRLRNLCIGDSSLKTVLGGVEIAERPAEQALSEDLNVEKTGSQVEMTYFRRDCLIFFSSFELCVPAPPCTAINEIGDIAVQMVLTKTRNCDGKGISFPKRKATMKVQQQKR